MRAIAGSVVALTGALAKASSNPDGKMTSWGIILLGLLICLFELYRPAARRRIE
jgi:hypothetical protein